MISIYIPQAQGTRASRRVASVGKGPYRCFPEAVYLRNEDAELVVVPSCGRIMSYSSGGEHNVLWENPALPQSCRPGHSFRAATTDHWTNFGGDKAWPWPQSRWPTLTSRAWPPPDVLERQPHQVRILSRCSLETISAPLPRCGLRIIREITLAPRGTRVTIRTTLDPIDENRAPAAQPWAAWSITQIATPSRIALRIDPNSNLPGGHRSLTREPWGSIRHLGGDILLTHAPRDHEAKFGADADVIAAEIGQCLFVQKRIADDDQGGRHLSGEAAQVYGSGPDEPYVEMEFTGPRAQRRPTLTVQWELLDWAPDATDAELAAALRST